MKYATVITVALLGCTASNPNYIGNSDGGGDASHFQIDGGVHDGPMSNADLTMTPKCSDGERRCEGGGTSSQICINGGFTLDRTCPMNSLCMNGYCQPPPESGPGSQLGVSCEMQTFQGTGPQENQCLQNLQEKLSCEPFFDTTAGGFVWRCDVQVGVGLPGTPCTMGAQCRSGFCGSNGTCFRACQSDQDCPQSGTGQQLTCNDVTIVVEGMQVAAASCTPN